MSPILHPDVLRIVSLLRDADLTPPVENDVHNVRHYLERVTRFLAGYGVPLKDERLLLFPVAGRCVPCKFYRPDSGHPSGLLFYCHGGGFRHGTLAGWDAPLRQLVRDSGAAVLSIEYALAPEHPFPAAFEEVVAIARRVIQDGAVAGLEVDRFAFGGDSAGANLTLGAALSLHSGGAMPLRQLLLFYGVYSKNTTSQSWRRMSGFGGQGLTADSMRRYWKSYLRSDEGGWRVEPLYAALKGLPPTRLVIGELDPLLDQNTELHQKLEGSDVDSNLIVSPGMVHGVLRFSDLSERVRDLVHVEATALRQSFLK